MISGRRTTTKIKVFFLGILQKFVNLKWISEESGSQKIFQKLALLLKNTEKKNDFFNPERFLEEFDQEKYFELLKGGK